MTSAAGYLASFTAYDTQKGSAACPWVFRTGSGRSLTLTLLDFDASRVVNRSAASEICHIYAQIREGENETEDQRKITVCGQETREKVIYSSLVGGPIHVTIHLSPPNTPWYFLIKYEGKQVTKSRRFC